MDKISNINIYNEGMKVGMADKLWFLERLANPHFDHITTIVDFGCADGTLIKEIEKVLPGRYDYVGIDNNPIMLRIASDNCSGLKVRFYNSIDKFLSLKKTKPQNCVLVLNSVIHEIYSYVPYSEQIDLFGSLYESGFGVIAIRDMFAKDTDICIDSFGEYAEKFEEVEKYTPHISSNMCILEFLLKYKYEENWEREKKEQYLWDWSEQIYISCSKRYYCEYTDYILPHFLEQWKKDFPSIWFSSCPTTHRKVFLYLK